MLLCSAAFGDPIWAQVMLIWACSLHSLVSLLLLLISSRCYLLLAACICSSFACCLLCLLLHIQLSYISAISIQVSVNPSSIAHISFVQAVRVHKFIVSQPISSSLFYG